MNSVAGFGYYDVSKGAIPKKTLPQSPATRPEDLCVTPWYTDETSIAMPSAPLVDHSSHPLFLYGDRDLGHPDLSSTQASSMEGEFGRPAGGQRKAYMDLRDAIALLDETCPNPDTSERSPRTPRTPLGSHLKNKRARSKSSDNSSNYSNERLSDKSMELAKPQEREKKRPFLRKIGISKTEDRPFLAKLAPRIIGKPYLEKIGPSKAVEKPFLERIGPSKTIDKFIFNLTPNHNRSRTRADPRPDPQPEVFAASPKKEVDKSGSTMRVAAQEGASFKRRSGKGQLTKMYSFEMEDLASFNEIPTPAKSPRDSFRGASLDDVLESGPSSLPPLDDPEPENCPVTEQQEFKSLSVVELVKCRIMSGEEIISSNSCLSSPQEAVSWGNSPKRKNESSVDGDKDSQRHDAHASSKDEARNDAKLENSPVKRQISTGSLEPQPKELAVLRPGEKSPTKFRRQMTESGSATLPKQKELFFSNRTKCAANYIEDSQTSPTRTRRQGSEDVLDKLDKQPRQLVNTSAKRSSHRKDKENFERRGISSDNLISSRETFISANFDGASRYQSQDICQTKRETASAGCHGVFPRRMESSSINQDFSKETFRQLHHRFEVQSTRGETGEEHHRASSGNHACNFSGGATNQPMLSPRGEAEDETNANCDLDIEAPRLEAPSSGEREGNDETAETRSICPSMTVRSVLRKQKSIDNQIDPEPDTRSLRRPKRRIFHQPSQETMDLLTELRKVKGLLKTPSVEKLDTAEEMPASRFPKKILLTDKEFCLSIERENSIRRPNRQVNKTKENSPVETSDTNKNQDIPVQEKVPPGPALFEKWCISLDYADDEKPQKAETRAISLASARSPPSEAEETVESVDFSLICHSKSYCSDVFDTPSQEAEDKDKTPGSSKDLDRSDSRDDHQDRNHSAEVDIAIPIDQKTSPRRRVQIQARTSDLYEIISPRSTPFRVKKRLSKISVEETLKQESFTLGKVDCRSVVVQKRTRCFPL